AYFGFSSIKDLPGSKDLTIAGGWATLLAGIPLTAHAAGIGLPAGSVGPWTFVMIVALLFFVIYRRTAILVLRDVQGDRIVGMESSFKFIGKGLAKKLHIGIDVLTTIGVVPLCMVAPTWAVPLLVFGLAWGLLASVLYHTRRMPAGNVGLFFLDCQFVLPGLAGVTLAILGMNA
ncbi:MAG: hypothetical protein HY042_09425, partial [Spirochaetia bacterium]|nr:hypothetical protein [Spirochaetia bacterium]